MSAKPVNDYASDSPTIWDAKNANSRSEKHSHGTWCPNFHRSPFWDTDAWKKWGVVKKKLISQDKQFQALKNKSSVGWYVDN